MEQISLDDMRLFVAVVQAGSLSYTQELTNIPVSKLSRRLTRLEQALGTKLLDRSKKGVMLNEVGERFFQQSQTMLQQAQFAVECVQNSLQRPQGLLRISIASDNFRLFLQPYLSEFLALYPDVNVEINLSHQKINMIQDGIDLAIRAGTVDNDNVVAKVWKEIQFGLFASREYLAKKGKPKSPNDLYRHHIISQMYTLPWRFCLDNRTVEIAPVSRVSCNDFELVKQQIEQGNGIGILPMPASNKNVIQLLPEWKLPTHSVSLIYYKNRGSVPIIRSFVEFLLKHSQETIPKK